MEPEPWDVPFTLFRKRAAFCAFDIETTGLDPRLDRIVEIGAVKFDCRGPMGRYSVLINPGIPMPEEAGRVNGISDDMLAGKPSLEEVLPDFLRFTGGAVITAHNAPFDCGFINEKLAALFDGAKKRRPAGEGEPLLPGLDPAGETGEAGWAPPFPALPNLIADTLILSRRLFPGRRSYKLQELARDMEIPAFNAHRAEDDARLCMELFLKCAGAAQGAENAG
ncbi:MAG: 3'-5' exonuclease [Treponema sp.]|nr:3'-5' exonuclease [Treponema sp.]